jgi:hypothetical protein
MTGCVRPRTVEHGGPIVVMDGLHVEDKLWYGPALGDGIARELGFFQGKVHCTSLFYHKSQLFLLI